MEFSLIDFFLMVRYSLLLVNSFIIMEIDMYRKQEILQSVVSQLNKRLRACKRVKDNTATLQLFYELLRMRFFGYPHLIYVLFHPTILRENFIPKPKKNVTPYDQLTQILGISEDEIIDLLEKQILHPVYIGYTSLEPIPFHMLFDLTQYGDIGPLSTVKLCYEFSVDQDHADMMVSSPFSQ